MLGRSGLWPAEKNIEDCEPNLYPPRNWLFKDRHIDRSTSRDCELRSRRNTRFFALARPGDPDEPNISSTRSHKVSDDKGFLYFFESALTSNTFWVDLKQVEFSLETARS